MKLTTRGEYGVLAMYDLAMHYGAGPVALKVIAARQGISEHYLEQLMRPLRKAGLVRSVRGAQGGYELARAPAEISVGDILREVEGPLSMLDCLADSAACKRSAKCAARSVWELLDRKINDVLDSTTLYHLCTGTVGQGQE